MYFPLRILYMPRWELTLLQFANYYHKHIVSHRQPSLQMGSQLPHWVTTGNKVKWVAIHAFLPSAAPKAVS